MEIKEKETSYDLEIICSFIRHEVRQTYPNKYINVDDRIYVFYTLFNLPGDK